MGELNFAVPTLFGLEGLCADEIRRLGLPSVQAENGRVLCTGTEGDLPRLNLNLQYRGAGSASAGDIPGWKL